MRIPLLGGSYEGISTNTSSQESINFFYEAPAPGESHIGAALPTHGAALFATMSNTASIRALLYNPSDNLLYVATSKVGAGNFYEVTSGGVATSRGSVGSTASPINMALNPSTNEILIVDGSEARHFDCDTNTWSVVTDADFPDTATAVEHINGYFLVNVPTINGRFMWSDLNDGLTYTSTSFSTAQSLTSPVRAIKENKGVIYLLGDSNGELWYNSGDSAIFTRFEKIDWGIAARDTLKHFDNSMAWLARNRHGELNAVRIGDGYTPEVISTPELTRKWGLLSAISDALAYTYQMDGHEFYVLTFPTGNVTYAYDAVTKIWHQRSGAFSGGSPTREKINACVFCGDWGGHVVGDFNATGKLWSLENSVYTFDSVNMERRLTGPLLMGENEGVIRFSEVQIDIEEGVATGAESGNDGQLTFYYSKNGGHTYSAGTQLNLGVGATTGYATRLMKRKLGKGRLWNFRIYTDTPRKIIIKGAYGRLYGEPKLGYIGGNATKK